MTLFLFNHRTYSLPSVPSFIAPSLTRSTLSSVILGRSLNKLLPDGVSLILFLSDVKKGPAVVSDSTAIMSIPNEGHQC